MRRLASFLLAQLALVGFAFAAAPAQQDVQGLYEGTAGDRKIEARVVALKDGYKVLIRSPQADGKVTKLELAGKTEGDAVKFTGKAGDVAWSGAYADGTIQGSAGTGTFTLKRVIRQSPTMGAKPPQGAIILIDGKNFDEMNIRPNKDGTPQQWKLAEDGAIQVPVGGMSSKRPIATSFRMHVEFKCPLMPAGEGQGRANSGCYLPNGEEIQVLDSFGMTTYTGGGCGGLYRYKDPDAFDEFSLASAPPLQWQTYDIEYRIQKKDGKPTGKPRLTVLHNGIKIHDNFEMTKDARQGGFQFQDHGNPVQYRNIWVQPIED